MAATTQRDRLQRLVPLLEDQSVLDQPRSWLRHGQRGFLHSRARCERFKPMKEHSELTLSINEALEQTTCDDCVADSLTDGGLWSALVTAEECGRKFTSAEQNIDDGGIAPSDLTRLLILLEDPNDNRWTRTNADLIAKERKRLDRQAEVLATRVRAIGRVSVEDFGPQMVTDVLRVHDEQSRELVVPGVDAAAAELLGKDATRYGRGNRADRVWEQWLQHRSTSTPITVAQLLEDEELVKIEQLAQLELTAPPEGGTVLEWAQLCWRAAVDDLAVELQQHWQRLADELLAETRPVLVGTRVSRSWNLSNEAPGLLTALGLGAADGETYAGMVPLLAAKWLSRCADGLRADYVDPTAHGEPLPDEAAVETVRALWAPLDDTSPYHELSDALASARLL